MSSWKLWIEDHKPICALLALVLVAVVIDGVFASVLFLGGNTLVFFVASVLVIVVWRGAGSAKAVFGAVSDGVMKAVVPMAVVFSLGSFIEVSSMTGVRGLFSYLILPYSTTAVMLVLMAAAELLIRRLCRGIKTDTLENSAYSG